MSLSFKCSEPGYGFVFVVHAAIKLIISVSTFSLLVSVMIKTVETSA